MFASFSYVKSCFHFWIFKHTLKPPVFPPFLPPKTLLEKWTSFSDGDVWEPDRANLCMFYSAVSCLGACAQWSSCPGTRAQDDCSFNRFLSSWLLLSHPHPPPPESSYSFPFSVYKERQFDSKVEWKESHYFKMWWHILVQDKQSNTRESSPINKRIRRVEVEEKEKVILIGSTSS